MFKLEFDETEEQMILDMIINAYVNRLFNKREYIREEAINRLVAELREEVLHSETMDAKFDKIFLKAQSSIMMRINKKFNTLEQDMLDNSKEITKRLDSSAKYMRDNIICTLIGFQNSLGNDESSPEYQAYQRILIMIEKEYGELMP